MSSRQDPERKIGAGSKSSSRILARKSLDTRKRFGLFNPLKRMATRSIEERKLGQGRGNGQHLFGNHPLPPPPLFFPLSPILPTFFYHPRLSLSLSLRQREFLFSFPTIKLKAKDHFLPDVCSTLLRRPFRSRSRIWADFETREFLPFRRGIGRGREFFSNISNFHLRRSIPLDPIDVVRNSEKKYIYIHMCLCV